MKKYFIVILLFLQVSAPAFSGVTLFGMKAEIWQKNSDFEKFIYIQGVFDGLAFSDFKVHDTELSTELTVNQYKKAVDVLYSDYKNTLIPVPFLLRVITLEIEGADSNAVESALETYRKVNAKK